MKEKYIYMIGAAVAIVLVCMILSVLFPAKAVAETEVNTIEPETAENDIMDPDFAEKPQNRPINGRIAVITPDALNVLEALERGRNESKTAEETEEEADGASDDGECREGDSTPERSGHDEGAGAGDPEDSGSGSEVYEHDAACTGGEEISDSEYTFYTVNGFELGRDLQRYLYDRLGEFGCEWFFRYALCQIFQESQYDDHAISDDGEDMGLCQFKARYFPSVAQEAGLVEYDIMNPIDSIYVYTWLMCKYLNETEGDVAMSLSLYFSGYGGEYAFDYVRDVTRWFDTVEEIEQ